MNAPTPITPAIDAERLARTAQQIVDAKPGTYDRFMDMAAQTYLDNLNDGYCEPDELLELLAEEQARDAHDELEAHRPAFGSGPAGYAQGDWDDANGWCDDASEYFDNNRAQFIASVRSAYEVRAAA